MTGLPHCIAASPAQGVETPKLREGSGLLEVTQRCGSNGTPSLWNQLSPHAHCELRLHQAGRGGPPGEAQKSQGCQAKPLNLPPHGTRTKFLGLSFNHRCLSFLILKMGTMTRWQRRLNKSMYVPMHEKYPQRKRYIAPFPISSWRKLRILQRSVGKWGSRDGLRPHQYLWLWTPF